MATFEKHFIQMETELRTAPQLPAVQADLVHQRLVGLLSARDDAFKSMQEPFLSGSTEPIESRFKERVQAAYDRWISPLSKTLDGISDPSTVLELWRDGKATYETAFIARLSDLNPARAFDELLALEQGLDKLNRDVQRKWDSMSEEAKRIEALEAEAGQRLNEVVNHSLHGATDAWARYGTALQNFLSHFQKVPDIVNQTLVTMAKAAGFPPQMAEMIPKVSLLGKDYFIRGRELGISAGELAAANPELMRDPGMYVSETFQKSIGPTFEAFVTAINLLYNNVLPVAVGTYSEQIIQYQRLLPNQNAVVVSFGQTQKDVEEYLQKNGLDKARSTYERMSLELSRWADGLPADGLKEDARLWLQPVMGALKERYERVVHLFEDFVRNNQGRFIGTPNKTVENALLYSDIWADRERGILAAGMDERLREWRAGTSTVSDTLASASSQVFAQLRNLPPELSDPITARLNEEWQKMVQRLNGELQNTNHTLQTAAEKVDKEQIRRDLDRRVLQEGLRR